MACPNCGSIDLEVVDELYLPDHHIERYQCNECGCVFTWESKRTIVEAPEEVKLSHETQLEEIRKRVEAEALAEEEEEDEER